VTRTLSVAFLVSGEGTTMEGVAERIERERIPARIVLVVSNRPGIPALERARRHGIPTTVVPSRGVGRETWSAGLTETLDAAGAELVVLAGFLAILPGDWVDRWRGRAINVHPSLLPRYGGPGMYGSAVHQAVLDAGDTVTGATVHLVTRDVDGGPALAQERVEVRPGDSADSLRARLHPIEVGLLVETIRRFAVGALPLPWTGAR
jgi:phosphoribosylglycinamide formyltransferase 1